MAKKKKLKTSEKWIINDFFKMGRLTLWPMPQELKLISIPEKVMVWTIFCSRIHRFQTIWLKLREGDCTTNFGAISLSSWTSRNVPLFWLPCSVECNLSSCGNCCFLRRLDSEKTLTTKGGGRRLLVFFKLVIYKSSKYDHIELHKKL